MRTMSKLEPGGGTAVVLGDRRAWPEHAEQISAGRVSEIVEAVRAGCEATGQRLAAMLPAAAGTWPFGASDWELRGHSILSVPVLMGSVVARLCGTLRPHRFATPETTASLWPAVIPITPSVAVSVPAGTAREALEALRTLFEGVPARVTFNSLDENGSLVPDARSQIVLAGLGLVKSVTGPRGSGWRLVNKPITVAALRAIGRWYRDAVETAVSGLQPVVIAATGEREEVQGLVALIAAGQAARTMPLPEANRSKNGILGRLARMMAGRGANVPGLTIWEDPWSVWDFSVEMAHGQGGSPCSSET